MNYYNEIKTELIKNEAYKQVKDYSKNKHDLETYYNVGKYSRSLREYLITKYSIVHETVLHYDSKRAVNDGRFIL